MNADRWLRVKQLFHATLEHPHDERAAFVARECGDDGELRSEVERLLAASAQAQGFIESSPVRSSMTGRSLGKYEVGRLIGAGGMGEVYEARDVSLSRQVAIKFGSDTDLAGQSRLRREAQHASQLNHPHICTIHEVGLHDGRAYIVMEYVEGRLLSQVIAPDGVEIPQVLRYGSQIADGLAHAHEHGVIHGDLKSENVIIAPGARAKILDFGLARRVAPERLTEWAESRESIAPEGFIAGTLSSMAPELLRGQPADERSDVWALGILLYQMVAGVRPFSGGTGFELSGAILHQPPPPLPLHVPAALRNGIQKCLEKDPAERCGSAADVRSALDSVRVPKATVFPRRVAAAFMGTLLVLAVVFTLPWRTSQERVAVGTAPTGRPVIAVLPFKNVGATADNLEWLSIGVPNMLVTGLAQFPGLEIVSEQRLNEVLKQKGKTSFSGLDENDASDIVRQAGAGAIVRGSIYRSGGDFRIDARVEDLASGRLVSATTVRGADVLALADQLTAQIRNGLGVASDEHVRRIADVSSTSLDAYRFYSDGLQAISGTRWADADRHLRSAVAADPSFGEAYLRLASVAGASGRRADASTYLRLAAEHANRLSERARLLLDLQLKREKGDAFGAGQALDKIVERFPDMQEAYAPALQMYRPVDGLLHDPQKILGIVKTGVTVLPSSPGMRNIYGYALLDRGRYAEAVREFEEYARLAPREPNPYDSLGDAHLRMGFAEKAVESYSRALTIDAAFSRNGLAFALATMGRFDEAIAQQPVLPQFGAVILSSAGRYRDAARAIDVGIREAEARGNPMVAGDLHLVSALLQLERKQYQRALGDVQAAEHLFASLPEEPARVHRVVAHTLAGAAEIHSGRIGRAVERSSKQRSLVRQSSEAENWWRGALEGEIALARGDLQAAEEAYTTGQPKSRIFNIPSTISSVLLNELNVRDGVARVAVARGDISAAIDLYRGLLAYGPEQKWIASFEPRFVLEIARLLDRKGDRTAARVEYERFVTFWKDADGDLPELAEARRALKR